MKFHISFLLSASAALTSAAVINPGNLAIDPHLPKSGNLVTDPHADGRSHLPKYANKFPHAPAIPGSYLVTLKKGATPSKHLDAVASYIGKPRDSVIHGDHEGSFCDLSAPITSAGQKVQGQFKEGEQFSYVGSFTDDTLKSLSCNDDVEVIEPNYIVQAQGKATQYGAPWGLSRLSNQARLSMDNRSVYNYQDYSTSNVRVYVVDSGINIDHEEFGGRAVDSASFVFGENSTDLFGHGTHVAGTIGGKTFGVAKQVKLFNVKILAADGTGSNAAVVAGINHVVSEKKKSPTSRFVLNMSIGGPQSVAEENALRAAIKAGIIVVVAAGNSNIDSCTTSPGSSNKDGAIVVGAISSKDTFANFSNWGTCVDVLAPGVDILSSWNTGPRSVYVLQGTSMASPHVAGLVAYWYAGDETLTPAKMKAKVLQYARSGKITGVKNNTPNKVVWNGL